jgi:hypothetical protein
MFRLSKWYMDCVTEGGDAAVLYWASLGLGPVRVRYGATLLRFADGTSAESVTLRPGRAPRAHDDDLRWACERLRVTGEWHRRTPAIERTLFEDRAGTVQWHCVMPRAVASVRVGAHTVEGLGYAEHLTMTLPPARVPCDVLHWGRYIAADDDVVWIEWRGTAPHTWAFRRGTDQASATVQDESVEFADVRLQISGRRELRSGRLRHTALRPLRVLVALLPRWSRAIETKWISSGALTAPESSSTGWIIHEVVQWP